MEQLRVVAENDEGRRFDAGLGHVVNLQALALVGRRLNARGGIAENVVEHTGRNTHGRLVVDVIDKLKQAVYALSGLGGICFAYSISANFSPSIYVGYGYLAIAAYIFGNWKILPTLGACLLFGLARSGGYKLVQVLGMPSSYQDLVMILPYALTLFLLIFFSKKNRAPRALGEIYDKGAR